MIRTYALSLTHSLRVLCHLLLLQHLQRRHGDLGPQGVAPEGRPVGAGGQQVHHLLVCQDPADGEDAAGEGLAEDHQVGPDGLVVAAQEAAGSAQAGLDLLKDN